MGILPSQTALLFHLIGEAVKAWPFEGEEIFWMRGENGLSAAKRG
jgi:hypothetical protein